MAKYVEYLLKLAFLISSFAVISSAQVPQIQHVFIVLEENTDNGDVCGPGSASMPFLCSLKSQGSFSENYYAATHPSIGNYEDLAWGVVTTNDDSCDPDTCGFPYTGDNIVREVQAVGKTWKGYAENLPSTCYLGGDSGEYAVRHSPIPYISDVQSNCLNRYVAFEDPNLGFAHDLAQSTLPNYAFITPNLCDDGHDCTLPGSSVPDSWLQNNVLQPLLTSGHLDPTTGDTVVIVTFDESESDNTNGGGLIYWFMIGKGVKQNYQSTGPSTPPGYYSHDSTLRLMAEMVGANFSGLGAAATAPDMTEFFGASQPPPVSVSISPASVTVTSGGTQQFSPTVTNTTNQSVTWATTAGTISATGLFTAPVVSSNTTVTITATSVANPSQFGSATVTVQSSAPPPVSVAVSPASSTVASGGTQQFTAVVVNATNQAVSWSATAGTISTAGLFAAPVVSSNTTVTITATSVASSSQSGKATISVQAAALPAVSVTVTSGSSTVASGGTQQFTATVANTTNQAVTWKATGGTISAAGLFTAPVVSTNTTATITATSVAAPSQSGKATVTVQPTVVPTSSSGSQHNSGFTGNANSVAVGFKSNVTAGDVLLVAESTYDKETLSAPSDSQGDAFSLLVTGDNPGNAVAALYMARAGSTGADTVTCSIGTGTSDNIHCHIYDLSGVTGTVDAVGSALQKATALSVSTSKATTSASDYVFAYFASDNSEPNYTAGPGFGDTEQSSSSSNDSGFSEDKMVTASGVQTAKATASVKDSFTELIVALKSSQTTSDPPSTGPSCTLSVSPSSGPVPLLVTAGVNCTDAQNSIVGTTITWGDGSTTSGSSGSHSYMSANSFTVTGTATDSAALTGSAMQTVTATSVAVPPAVSVTVTSGSSTVASGGTQQFTATVANTTNQAVTWKATGGTISAAGLFTAPVVSTNTTATITATSVAAPSQSGKATVTVQPTVVPTSSSGSQHNSGFTGNANSVAVGFKSNVTAGDVLLVAESTYDKETLSAPSDSQGDAFSLLVTGDNPGNAVAALYMARAGSTGADTVTCSIGTGTSDNIHCHIYDLSGVTGTVDAVGSALQKATALSVSTSKATTSASDYVFAYFASDNSEPNYTAGPGFGDTEQSSSSSNDSGFSEDKMVTASGVQTAKATASVKDSFTELIVALKSSQTTSDPPSTGPSCTLSVSPSSGPVPLLVTAGVNCTDAQNSIVGTTITWGDGSTTSGSSGSHSYMSANSFTVTGTATDSAALTGSAMQTVTATSVAVPPAVSVTVTSGSSTVASGGTQQFTATVANTTNQAVTWNATGGTISTAGLFTAPVVSTNTTATITATSVAAPSQSGSAALQVLASGPTTSLTPSGPIAINGQNGTVVENLHITNPNGDCVMLTNSTNITIRRSEIGPCGGNGVHISGGNTIAIYDSYIHPEKPLSTACCDTHDGVFANGTSNLAIQGNVIAYGESNIEVNKATTVTVIGNFLLNPIDSDPSQPAEGQSRGQNFQAWSNSSNVTVQNNYALSSTDTAEYLFAENQEDSINFGVTNGVTAGNNYITGGHSPSGCGLIADSGANSVNFLSNTLLNTGQCGIGIADGTNQLVDSNKILNQTPVIGGGNTALYVWKATPSNPACGPVTVSNNIVAEIRSDGTQSGFWNGGGCEPVTLTNNTFDSAAVALLEPASQTMPPPQIPPLPKDCVASSPFTNNTSLLPCSTN